MDFITVSLALLVIVCFYLYLRRNKLPAGMPPVVKRGYPLLGNALEFSPRDYITFKKYRELYGEMCVVYLGTSPSVLLNSYRSIYEAFVGQADTFSGRPSSPFEDLLTRKSGIMLRDDPQCLELRRFVVRMLREFGMGRSMSESIVQEECQTLVEYLRRMQGKPIDSRQHFKTHTFSIISRFTFNESYSTEDEGAKEFFKLLDCILKVGFLDIFAYLFPIISKYSFLTKLNDRISSVRLNHETMYKYVRRKVEQHRNKLLSMEELPSELSEASDVCEAMLIEQVLREKDSPNNHLFTEWQVIRTVFELFLAGTDTTASTLSWCILLLALNEDIQEHVHQEIDDKIGSDRLPCIADLKELHYIHAFMDEVLRYSSLVGSNVLHRTTKATNLLGYHIPENMIILSNLYGVHRDPEFWERPDEFYPNHFLNDEGEYRASKYLIPFSAGKRACLGEGLAKLEIFITLVSILQTFNVSLVRNSDTKIEEILAGTPNGVRHPGNHEIIFSIRNDNQQKI